MGTGTTAPGFAIAAAGSLDLSHPVCRMGRATCPGQRLSESPQPSPCLGPVPAPSHRSNAGGGRRHPQRPVAALAARSRLALTMHFPHTIPRNAALPARQPGGHSTLPLPRGPRQPWGRAMGEAWRPDSRTHGAAKPGFPEAAPPRGPRLPERDQADSRGSRSRG